MDNQRNGVQFPAEVDLFLFFSYHTQTNSEAQPAFYPTGNVRSFPEEKLAGA